MTSILNNKKSTYFIKLCIYITLILSLLKTADLQAQHFMFYKIVDEDVVPMPTYINSSFAFVDEIGGINEVIITTPDYLIDDVLFAFVVETDKYGDTFDTPTGWTLVSAKEDYEPISYALYYKRATTNGNEIVTFDTGTIIVGNKLQVVIVNYRGVKNIGVPYNVLNDEAFQSSGLTIAPYLTTQFTNSSVLVFTAVYQKQTITHSNVWDKAGWVEFNGGVTFAQMYYKSPKAEITPLTNYSWQTVGVADSFILELINN